MVGVTSQHISHVERCQTKPSLTLLVDISTALRVDLYTLLGSNIPVHPDVSISVEFASMLKDAAPEQVKLCLSVCKTIIEHGERPPVQINQLPAVDCMAADFFGEILRRKGLYG